MLTAILLVLMTLVILVLVALAMYLVDRFNGLERDTKELLRQLQDSQPAKPSGPYGGLSGKSLWDAVSGQAAGMDELALDGIRKRYRLLLSDHIQWVFNEGVSDHRNGLEAVPANTRMMRTPKVQVESWLPPEAVEEIYRCGQGYGRADPLELPSLRQRLDSVNSQLHQACALEVLQPASSLLMPPLPEPPPAGAPANPSAGATDSGATTPAP